MPFDNYENPSLIEDAKTALVKFGANFGQSAFMAGGYVRDGNVIRNVVFLVYQGRVIDSYFKRIPWDEDIEVGDRTKVFKWGAKFKYSCIPLICADAGDDNGQRKSKMMADAISKGAGPNTPIVICSYGGGLRTPYWHHALHGWAKGTEAPVVICGVSGQSEESTYYDHENIQQKFGGGGSGVLWPDGEINQVSFAGVFILDMKTRVMESRNLKWTELGI
jgi:predicted amidohydrolase